jgi:hypothetical protein
MAGCVGRDLKAISAKLHTAPAPRSLLADVIKVEDALIALSNAFSIRIGEERGGAVGEGGKQVFWLSRGDIQSR